MFDGLLCWLMVWCMVVGLSVCLLLVASCCVVMWLFGVDVVLFGCVCGIGGEFGMYCVFVGMVEVGWVMDCWMYADNNRLIALVRPWCTSIGE